MLDFMLDVSTLGDIEKINDTKKILFEKFDYYSTKIFMGSLFEGLKPSNVVVKLGQFEKNNDSYKNENIKNNFKMALFFQYFRNEKQNSSLFLPLRTKLTIIETYFLYTMQSCKESYLRHRPNKTAASVLDI